MSDELKLIMELCKALGFDVEINRDYDERKEGKDAPNIYGSLTDYPHTRGRMLKCSGGLIERDIDGNCTSALIKPVISYTLTKRGE